MPRQPYPTDLTETEWARLAPLLPPPDAGAPPGDPREILNAALYVLNGGCGGDLLPHEFPPWETVAQVVQQWRQDGTWAHLQATFQEAGLVPAEGTSGLLGDSDR